MKARIISMISTIWKILWRTILFFILWGVLLVPFVVPLNSSLARWKQTSPIGIRLYNDSFSLLTILLATWILIRFLDRRPFGTIGLSFDNILKYFLTGSGIGILWLGGSLGIAWIFAWASVVQPVGFVWMIFAGTAISMFFNVIAQELLLCGFIFQTIRRESNTITAIIVSSILFMGYHFGAYKGEWLAGINVFAAGLLFCLAYIKTGSLWFPIFIHFTWDMLVGPLLGMTESGRADLVAGWKMVTVNGPILFTGGQFGFEGGLIVTFTVTIVIVFIYNHRDKKIHAL
jgi:membrane protease YdiL (CAAX protease family)